MSKLRISMYRYSGIILEFLWVVDINHLLPIEEKIIFHSQKMDISIFLLVDSVMEIPHNSKNQHKTNFAKRMKFLKILI